jgi:hypothetical protein
MGERGVVGVGGTTSMLGMGEDALEIATARIGE